MITIQEAEKIIAKTIKVFPATKVPLPQANNHVLREDVYADRDQPAFTKSTMDGIAIKSSAWKRGINEFTIQAVQVAGQSGRTLKSERHCVEIMTGAVMPTGADAVIPIEKIQINKNRALVIEQGNLNPRDNVVLQGTDHKKGNLLLEMGCLLKPAHIGVLAAVGKAKVKVTRKLKIAVVSTGNELVDINTFMLKPYQIRKSNSYALQAIFDKYECGETKIFHVKDNLNQMRWQLRTLLRFFDVIVLSGGVSMGKLDLVPQVLAGLGVTSLFHKIQQKPGKPMWFGTTRNGKAVFGLPGNPVSTQVCAYRYVLPYLLQVQGAAMIPEWGILEDDLYVETDLAYFAPVRIFMDDSGRVMIRPAEISGSGDFSALTRSDGFAEFPAGEHDFKKDTKVRIFRW